MAESSDPICPWCGNDVFPAESEGAIRDSLGHWWHTCHREHSCARDALASLAGADILDLSHLTRLGELVDCRLHELCRKGVAGRRTNAWMDLRIALAKVIRCEKANG